MNNELMLICGQDIPFPQAKITIHQPTIKEISYIGEEAFYTGCEMLRITKENLNIEDKVNLEEWSNFDILMSILRENNASIKHNKTCVMLLLSLLFPTHLIKIDKNKILLTSIENNEESFIDNNNFNDFLDILNSMFDYGDKNNEKEYNPQGKLSKRIADKLKERQKKLLELKKKPEKIAVLSRYISILAVAENKDINTLKNYTVFQLLDEFKRYELKTSFDAYMKAALAGVKDLKQVDDWMEDIHPNLK